MYSFLPDSISMIPLTLGRSLSTGELKFEELWLWFHSSDFQFQTLLTLAFFFSVVGSGVTNSYHELTLDSSRYLSPKPET